MACLACLQIHIVKTELTLKKKKYLRFQKQCRGSSNQNPHEVQGKYSWFPVYVISPQADLFKGNTGVPYVYYEHTGECSANILSVNRDIDLAKRQKTSCIILKFLFEIMLIFYFLNPCTVQKIAIFIFRME